MLNKIRVFLLVFFASVMVHSLALPAMDWRQLKGDHFIVFFAQDEDFAKAALLKAESYYRSIAQNLGYSRYSEFWTWDKRVKIYIYPDQDAYHKATAQPEWSSGVADYAAKSITSFIWSQGFLESLLPHEIAHLVFRDFVGFKGEVPLWLDEGVAQWAEIGKRAELQRKTRDLLNQDALLSFQDMMKIDIRKITAKDRLYIRPIITREGDKGILFLSGDELVNTYYLESFSLVDFLMHKYGSDLFVHFCRYLRDGKNFKEALNSAYTVYINNQEEFTKQWIRYIEEAKDEDAK